MINKVPISVEEKTIEVELLPFFGLCCIIHQHTDNHPTKEVLPESILRSVHLLSFPFFYLFLGGSDQSIAICVRKTLVASFPLKEKIIKTPDHELSALRFIKSPLLFNQGYKAQCQK